MKIESPFYLLILDIIVNAVRQEKGMKDILIRYEKTELPLLTVDMTI